MVGNRDEINALGRNHAKESPSAIKRVCIHCRLRMKWGGGSAALQTTQRIPYEYEILAAISLHMR